MSRSSAQGDAGWRPRPFALLLGLLCILGVEASCGYSTGLAVPDHQHTIGIEVFGNESLERDVERRLYDELSRAVRDWTDAPLVAPEHADVVMRGKITAYHRRSGVRSPTNELLETAVFIDAEAALYRSGTAIPTRGPVHATSAVGYIVGPLQNESVARDRSLHNLADKLVLDLFAPVN